MVSINSAVLKFIVFPALAILWRYLSPLIAEVVPLNKEVVHVRSLDQKVGPNQYPILDFVGLVSRHGYTAEEHTVETDDGYILRLHRISGTPTRPKAPGKPVVYMQHGIGLSSDSYVLIGPGKDLAFLWADAGYDVWLGNVRGNTYSRSHKTISPTDDAFWQFSYHEMATKDIPAFIDFILKETGEKNLTYYGYSMGTTISFTLLAMRPEYKEKINMIHAAAPVVFWKHELKRLMKIVNAAFDPITEFYTYFDIQEILTQTALNAYIGKKFCGDDDMVTQPLCVQLFSNIGLDPARCVKSALPDILAHFPAGTSVINVYHYNQNFKRNSYQAYDYGLLENQRRYGSITPPVYNLANVVVPVAIWYAVDEDIVNKEDVKELAERLPNVVSLEAVKNDKFNHFDFLWAKDVKELLYDSIIKKDALLKNENLRLHDKENPTANITQKS